MHLAAEIGVSHAVGVSQVGLEEVRQVVLVFEGASPKEQAGYGHPHAVSLVVQLVLRLWVQPAALELSAELSAVVSWAQSLLVGVPVSVLFPWARPPMVRIHMGPA